MLAEDAPYISLWYKTNVAVSNAIEGVKLTPSAEFTFLRDVTSKGTNPSRVAGTSSLQPFDLRFRFRSRTASWRAARSCVKRLARFRSCRQGDSAPSSINTASAGSDASLLIDDLLERGDRRIVLRRAQLRFGLAQPRRCAQERRAVRSPGRIALTASSNRPSATRVLAT